MERANSLRRNLRRITAHQLRTSWDDRARSESIHQRLRERRTEDIPREHDEMVFGHHSEEEQEEMVQRMIAAWNEQQTEEQEEDISGHRIMTFAV